MNRREYFLVYKARLALEVKLGNLRPRRTIARLGPGGPLEEPRVHQARMDFCQEVFAPYDYRPTVLQAEQLLSLDDQSLLDWLLRRLAHNHSQAPLDDDDFPNLDEDGDEEDELEEIPATEEEAPLAAPRRVDQERREENRLLRAEIAATRRANDPPQIRRGNELPTRGQPVPPVPVEAVDADYVSPRTRAGRIARINRQIAALEAEHAEDYLLPPGERQLLAGQMVDRLTEFAQQLEDLGHDSSKMRKKQSKTKKVVERATPEPKKKVIKRRLTVGKKRPSVPPHQE
mgnify:CR=1 FL=1